jgi:enamine deaminase RidA (YjgF/YER057c/UK114 family)
MPDRIYVPFDDAWGMQIVPRVSQGVRIGRFGATCGQCDLDAAGQPRHPGELWPQVEVVGRHLRRRLEQVSARPDRVRRLEAFYVGPADEERLRTALCEELGSETDVLLIPLEHFYYPGMLIELDAFFEDSEELTFRTGDGDDVESILEQLGLPEESLLAARIYYRDGDARPPETIGTAAVTAVPLATLPCPVRLAAIAANTPPSDLLFLPGQLPLEPGDLAAQTRAVMTRLGSILEQAGASFADLLKVTTHYVGTDIPDELHRTLEIRSQFYAEPGPASTGIPVPRLEPGDATLVVEAIVALNATST